MATDKEREALGNMIDAFEPRDYEPDILNMKNSISQKINVDNNFYTNYEGEVLRGATTLSCNVGGTTLSRLFDDRDFIHAIKNNFEKGYVEQVADRFNQKVEEMILKNLEQDGYFQDFIHDKDEEIKAKDLYKFITLSVDGIVKEKITYDTEVDDLKVILLISPDVFSKLPREELYRDNSIMGFKYSISRLAPRNSIRVAVIDSKYLERLHKKDAEFSQMFNELLDGSPIPY